MKVITLSKIFMKSHPKHGKETGFRELFLNGYKIHTIRSNSNGHLKDGDIVSIREWSGRPYASIQRIIKDGIKIGIERIVIDIFPASYGEGYIIIAKVEGKAIDFSRIAKNDGLKVDDMFQWFFPLKRGERSHRFEGDIIHFTDFRYTNNEWNNWPEKTKDENNV